MGGTALTKRFVNSWIESNDFENKHTLFFQFVNSKEVLSRTFNSELEAIEAQKTLISSIPSYEKIEKMSFHGDSKYD